MMDHFPNKLKAIKEWIAVQAVNAHYSDGGSQRITLQKMTDISENVRKMEWRFILSFDIPFRGHVGKIRIKGQKNDSAASLSFRFTSHSFSYRDLAINPKYLETISNQLAELFDFYFPNSIFEIKAPSESKIQLAQQELRKEDAFKRYAKARQLVRNKQYHEALVLLDDALELHPVHFKTYAPYWKIREKVEKLIQQVTNDS